MPKSFFCFRNNFLTKCLSLGLVLRYVISLRGRETVRQIGRELAQKTVKIKFIRKFGACVATQYTYVYVYAFKMLLEIQGCSSPAYPLQLSSLCKDKEKTSAHGKRSYCADR